MKKLKNAVLLLVALVGFTFLFSYGAYSQQSACGPHSEVTAKLEADYQEETRAIGFLPDGQILQILSSPKGTFTLLIVSPQGVACLVATGEQMEYFKQSIKEKGSDS